MSSPGLFIIAGPNGAGKSLFSKELAITELEIFDGDKHMAVLVKKYPETGSEALWSYINENIFEEQKQKVITSRQNFAFETNFSSADPMKTAREFRKAGYQIHLLFMGLPSLDESMERVTLRVRRGGHKVSEDSIRYNFEYGYKNLYKYITEFDTVLLLDNSISLIGEYVLPKEIMFIENGEVLFKKREYPAWVQPIVETYKNS
jgi:predicted ABC-type ATPase